MVWTITGTINQHIVMVDVQFTYSNRQLVQGSGYTPDVSPMQLTGTINGTQLTLTKGNVGPIEQIGTVGVFTFTSNQMEGTWHDQLEWCIRTKHLHGNQCFKTYETIICNLISF